MNNNYDYILGLIESNEFSCYEDAIDLMQEYYKSGKITLSERNELINLL